MIRRRKAIGAAATGWVEGLELRRLLSASPVTLIPIADADVENSAANAAVASANFGGDPSLRAGGTSSDQFITYITFDLSSAPSVGQAILSLNGSESVPPEGANPIGVYSVNDPSWIEGTGIHPPAGSLTTPTDGSITWNNRPAIGTSPLDTASVLDPSPYTWNITSYVQQAKNLGLKRISVALESQDPTLDPVIFGSRENSASIDVPTLTVAPDTTPPQAAFSAPNVTSASEIEKITVTYTDDAGLNATTIDANDLAVTGPGGMTVAVAGVTVNASNPDSVVATYSLVTPGGQWTSADNGMYAVTLQPGQVIDLGDNSAVGGPAAFQVSLPAAPDTQPPTAIATAPNINDASATEKVTVVYTDNVAVRGSTIATSNLTVARAGATPLKVTGVSVNPVGGGPSVAAVYTLAPPAGGWTAAANGTYVINVSGVTDTSGNGVVASPGSFTVSLPNATAPQAKIITTAVTAGGAGTSITVVYSDALSINAATISPANLSVQKTGSPPLAVTGVKVTPAGNGSPLTAVYAVAAPGGAWIPADNGTYAVTLLPNQVFDTTGIAAPVTSASLEVNVAGPNAAITPPSSITAPGGARFNVVVAYKGPVDISAGSITPASLTVTAPGGAALAVTGVSVMPAANGSPLVATYAVAVPGGAWAASANGVYTVAVNSGVVSDIAGDHVGGASAAFQVNIPTAGSNPTTTLGPLVNITAPGVTTDSVSVTYAATDAIVASTITPAGLVVTGPAGTLAVTGVTTAPSTNSSTIVATYTVAAPAGGWTAADDGTYTVSTIAGTVKDVAGLPAQVASGTFHIAIVSDVSPIDQSFNAGNPVVTGFVTEASISDGNGSILLAGHQGGISTGTGQSVLQRLNADGSLDTFFGQGGQVISNTTGDAFFAVTTDVTGRIIAAGERSGSILVERFKANGTLDRRFGARGTVVASLGSTDAVAYSVVVTPNGDILVGGTSGGQAVALRYLASGRLDSTFGTAGVFKTGATAGNKSVVCGLALETDATIVAAVSSADGVGGASDSVLRINANGTLDTEFGAGGVQTIGGLAPQPPASGAFRNIGFALQKDGKILLADRSSSGDFGLVRLNADGSTDTTLGTNGLVTSSFGGSAQPSVVAVEATGQIYVIGMVGASSGNAGQVAVSGYNSDGTPLTSLNSTGSFVLAPDVTSTLGGPAGGVTHAYGTLEKNGQLLVGATDENASVATASSLRRLNVAGSGSLGTFGQVAGLHGKSQSLTFIATDGSVITFSLKGGGSAQAMYDGHSVSLVVSGTNSRTALSIKTRRGALTLGNITSAGPLHSIVAKTATLTGTLFVDGAVGSISLAGISDGTLAAAGVISSIAVAGNVAGATVLSGANLGSDGELGGIGSAADSFQAGAIRKLKISGAVTGSLFGAGLSPAGGAVSLASLAGAQIVGGAASSFGSIVVTGGVDAPTRFAAAGFGKVRIPRPTIPATDPHFVLL